MSPWPAPEHDIWRSRPGILPASELRRALDDRPAWRLDGDRLVRELRFRDFREAFGFVVRLGGEVEDFGRHPDICLVEGNRVRVTIANPRRAGLSVAELRLVSKVDAVVDDHLDGTPQRAPQVAAGPHDHPLGG